MAATAEPRVDREALRQLNLYEVLQVSAKASPEVVHAAYRVLARLYHPDVNDTPHGAQMMRQVNAAYRVLSNPERRAKYDAQRAHMWRARSAVSMTRPPAAPGEPATVVGSRPVVLPTQQARPSWKVGRLIALLMVLMLLMGAMLFAFWVVASILDEDPHVMVRTAMTISRVVG